MRTRTKLLIAAISATALLSMAVSAAFASRLELPNWERGFRIVWNSLRLEGPPVWETSCPLTLEGTFERSTYVKIPPTRVGRVTGATVGGCTRTPVTLLRETLPWEFRYASFGGTLPNITSVSMSLIRFSFREFREGIECLAATRVEQPTGGIATVEASGAITGFRADETRGIETGGGFFCAFGGRVTFAGQATSITERGGAGAIRVRLIEGPRLSPTPVAFGTVEQSSTTERTVTIQNGSETITVNEIGMTIGTFYSISDPNSCRGARLAANATCAFTVTFRAPAELGRSASDTINVGTTAGRLTDSVSGSTPELPTASPSPVEFGRLATRTLARREVTITSGVEARIESIRVRTGTNFSIVDPNRCIGTRLAANGRCTFNVLVETPGETERRLEDTVIIGTSLNTIEDALRAST